MISTSEPRDFRLFITLPAPPRRVFSFVTSIIGTGDSGEIRLDEPNK